MNQLSDLRADLERTVSWISSNHNAQTVSYGTFLVLKPITSGLLQQKTWKCAAAIITYVLDGAFKLW